MVYSINVIRAKQYDVFLHSDKYGLLANRAYEDPECIITITHSTESTIQFK